MRAIKFRIRDGANPKAIVLEFELSKFFTADFFNGSQIYNILPKMQDPLIWEQSTGLLDKNGKEIWERDVVMVRSQYEMEAGDKPIESPNEVYFCDGAFRCGFHDMILGEKVCTGSEGNWNMQVIGNIHENPELLTPPV